MDAPSHLRLPPGARRKARDRDEAAGHGNLHNDDSALDAP